MAELDGNWPPILVDGDNFTIIDGYYRYLAARSLGHAYIYCHYFKGDSESAYVEAVRRNTKHGLPLTPEERKNAACRLIEVKPDWSDGRIAQICSLSPTTVGRIRKSLACPTIPAQDMDKRVGRDNRSRPCNSVEARRQIADAIDSQPDASLRKIASLVGCSPETVRSVRSALTAGPDASADSPTTGLLSSICRDRPVEARQWSGDSALGSTEDGSTFAEWFERTSIAKEWHRHVLTIPVSRIYEVADEARRRAQQWSEFADAVEARVRRLSAS
jgi:ParB-like chromosome segregation protein Spo0J